jgi:YVTN family beta-propeller protein
VIDGGTNQVVATIPLGKRPRGIKVSPDGTKLFVALSGSPMAPPGTDESKLPPPDRTADGIGIVDIAARKVATVLTSGTDPEQISLSADGSRVFVSNEDAGVASIIDVASSKIIGDVKVGGEPEGVTTSPNGQWVYVTSEEDNQVAVIDTASNKVIKLLEVGARPRSSAFLPDSSRAYVTAENGGTVHVVDTKSHSVVKTLKITGEMARPMGVTSSPDGTRVYVADAARDRHRQG